jgi:5-oxoprolinase (ATP-hydrolysing) subunit A
MKTIDINCDCGESFGNWSLGRDAEIVPRVTTANVACGFHAGDPMTMLRTIEIAEQGGTKVGAHPGLPDLLGFGRRRMAIGAEEVYAYVVYQAGAMRGLLEAQGMTLHHVKPHGALYLMLNEEQELADAVARAICAVCPSPRLYWPAPVAGLALPEAAKRAGIDVVPEVYFDLEYDDSGRLILQRKKVPVDPKRAGRRVREFLRTGRMDTASGASIAIEARSICIHGDGPNAVELLGTIREAVAEEGWQLAAASQDAAKQPARKTA